MADTDLQWKPHGRKQVFTSRVFSVSEIESSSPRGEEGSFSVIESNDWAIIVPVLETERGREFVMVRQWRHGAACISLEFPGGVIEKGENMIEGAKRELHEETACVPGKITHLATMSPNPAIMANQVHFFLAEDLKTSGGQELDKDEFVDIVRKPVEEVIRDMGSPPYIHALMATALCHYLRQSR